MMASALVFSVAGCGDDSGTPVGVDDTRECLRSSDCPCVGDCLVSAHARALETLDASAYADLLAVPGDHGPLDAGFRFHVRPGDEADFPWLVQPWWSRAVELGMMRNAFDPSFSGESPVQFISVEFTILNKVSTTDSFGVPVSETTVDMIIDFRTAPESGYQIDTRLVFVTGFDTGRVDRIRAIREISKPEPGRASPTSWGLVKSLYRGGTP
ncbi:MAG TPA: hypothetical protein VKU85_10560 [bacterium]|nr:hypothetical protein [bacterium]